MSIRITCIFAFSVNVLLSCAVPHVNCKLGCLLHTIGYVIACLNYKYIKYFIMSIINDSVFTNIKVIKTEIDNLL